MPALVLFGVNQHTTFEMPGFVGSKDMIGVPKSSAVADEHTRRAEELRCAGLSAAAETLKFYIIDLLHSCT